MPSRARRSIALGSVKSNIGHLKAAAGAAGLLKTVLALHEKVLPPSIHFDRPNPGIDFAHSPLRVNTELRDWELPEVGVRRAGVSAFGFGGTNFHGVLDEYVPGRLEPGGRTTFAIAQGPSTNGSQGSPAAPAPEPPAAEAGDGYQALGRLFAQFVERRAPDLIAGRAAAPADPGLDPAPAASPAPAPLAAARPLRRRRRRLDPRRQSPRSPVRTRRSGSWAWWRRRRGTRRTCWTRSSTWRRTWAWTR